MCVQIYLDLFRLFPFFLIVKELFLGGLCSLFVFVLHPLTLCR